MVTLAKLFGKWGTDKAFVYYPGVCDCESGPEAARLWLERACARGIAEAEEDLAGLAAPMPA